MKYLNRSVLACILTVAVSAPALSSAPHEVAGPGPRTPAGGINAPTSPVVPHVLAAVPTGQQVEKELRLLNRPDIPPDMRRTILHAFIDNPQASREQVFAVAARLSLHGQNWEVIEKDYFNNAQIKQFVAQAISPESKEQISEQEVIKYFGLDTPRGKLNFLRHYGKGLPEVIASKRFEGAFNAGYFEARNAILGNINAPGFYFKASGLKILPKEIGRMENLKHLNLSDNQLAALPAELGNLANLDTLDLSINQLTSLPAELGRLKILTALSLNGNQLTTLPAELGGLRNLRFLNLNNNKLTSLPAELGNLNLADIRLYDNPLTTLPDSLRQNKLRIQGFTGTFVPPQPKK